jgi:hypothetical protein
MSLLLQRMSGLKLPVSKEMKKWRCAVVTKKKITTEKPSCNGDTKLY